MVSKNNNITISGMLIAVGILLPIVFHAFKMGGQIFLPMHLPVLIGGFLLPWQFSGAIGLMTPFLSFLFTSMPPAPGVFVIMLELFTYGTTISIFSRKMKWGLYPSLISAMLIGRLISILGNWILITIIVGQTFNLPKFISSLFVVALPGIIIQLILVPIMVKLLSSKRKTISVNK